MSFEESPSLNDYQNGLPENLPDPSVKKRRFRIILGILFGISLFLAIANFMQSATASLIMGTGSIQGKVVDGQGSPFAGDVFVIGVDTIVHIAPDGSFFLDRIPSGDQSLVVANLTTGQEHPVKVLAGKTLNIGQVQFLVTATPGQ